MVITLSRQSLASLAVASKLTPQQVATKLAACLRGLGAKAVLDAGTGRDLALMEAAAEFLDRYRAQHPELQGEQCTRQEEKAFQGESLLAMAGNLFVDSYQQIAQSDRSSLLQRFQVIAHYSMLFILHVKVLTDALLQALLAKRQRIRL